MGNSMTLNQRVYCECSRIKVTMCWVNHGLKKSVSTALTTQYFFCTHSQFLVYNLFINTTPSLPRARGRRKKFLVHQKVTPPKLSTKFPISSPKPSTCTIVTWLWLPPSPTIFPSSSRTSDTHTVATWPKGSSRSLLPTWRRKLSP